MTITAALLTKGSDDTDANTYTTASVTLRAGYVYFMAITNAKGTTPDTPVSTSWTITDATNGTQLWADAGTATRRTTVFRQAPSVDATAAISITFGGVTQTGCHWEIVEVAGQDTSGTNGSGAVVQVAKAVNDTSTQTVTVTLAAFGNANNATLCFLSKNSNTTSTVKTGFTDLGQTGGAAPSIALQGEFLAANDTVPSWTWTGTAVKNAAVALEIKSATTTPPEQNPQNIVRYDKLKAKVDQLASRIQLRTYTGTTNVAAYATRLQALYTNVRTGLNGLLSDSTDISALLDAAEAEYTAISGSVPGGGSTAMPLIKGLLTREGLGGAAYISGYNPETTWANLQATEGGAIVDPGLTFVNNVVTAGNGKLRIDAGFGVPAWLKTKLGTFLITNPQNGRQENVPPWWTSSFVAYWNDFDAKMGILWDGVLKHIWFAARMTIYAEAYRCGFTSGSNSNVTGDDGRIKTGIGWAAENVANALAAGYQLGTATTVGTDLWALKRFREIETAHWKQTRVGIAYSAMDYIDGSGKGANSNAMAIAQMDSWIAALGSRHVLANNGFADAAISNKAGPRPYTTNNTLFNALATRYASGSPIGFQTQTYTNQPTLDLTKTAQFAIDLGAHYMELPSGYAGDATFVAAASGLDTALKANES